MHMDYSELERRIKPNLHTHLPFIWSLEAAANLVLESLKVRPNKLIVIVCSNRDMKEYQERFKQRRQHWNITPQGVFTCPKSPPSIVFVQCLRGNEEVLAGYCKQELRFIASREYLTERMICILKASITDNDCSIVTYGYIADTIISTSPAHPSL